MPCETLTQAILDENYVELKTDIEKVVAKKLHNRINEAKTAVLAKFNGVPKEKMAEMITMAVAK